MPKTYICLPTISSQQTNQQKMRSKNVTNFSHEKKNHKSHTDTTVTHSSVLYFMCNYLNTTEYINCALHSLMSSEK